MVHRLKNTITEQGCIPDDKTHAEAFRLCCHAVAGSMATRRTNIGKLCIKNGMNECYNKMALEAHNTAREKHQGYIPLKLDVDIAKAIQAQLDKPGFAGTIAEADKGKYASCGENMFGLTDLTKLSDVLLTNIATDEWYTGSDYYDFTAGTPKAGQDQAKIKLSN